VPDGRPAGEDAGPKPIVASEEAFVAPDAVVYLLVEDACFEVSGKWEGREEVHEPLPEDFEEDARFLVGPFGFVECVEEYGVELCAAEVDSSEEADEGAVFLCGQHALLESDTQDVGVLVVELVDASVVHNASRDDEVGEVGHESGVLSMLHCGGGFVVVC
jgi:hypothetical protein